MTEDNEDGVFDAVEFTEYAVLRSGAKQKAARITDIRAALSVGYCWLLCDSQSTFPEHP
jgi:hypothetical protein